MRDAVLLVILCLVSSWGQASAQTIPSRELSVTMAPAVSLTPEQIAEVGIWVKKMRSWSKYDQTWLNRVEKNNAGVPYKHHRQVPEAPPWLAARCENPAGEAALAEACLFFARIGLDTRAAQIANDIQAQRQAHEKNEHNSFLTKIHIDGLWTQPQLGSSDGTTSRVYGLVGLHIGLVEVGKRIQFFGPPGVMISLTRDAYGAKQTRIGYTWGMSVKLTDFHVPFVWGSGQNATLNLDMVKCWLHGTGPLSAFGNLNLAGFSISPAKKK